MDNNRTNTQQYNHPNQKDLRRQLRKGGEAPEAVLWTLLKNRQIEGMKFRRQFGVGPYILDFYCPEIKLGVELDGAHHFMSSNFDYDDIRTKYLFQEHGIRIIRFENRTLFYNPEGVVESIIKVIKKLKENNNNKPLRPTDNLTSSSSSLQGIMQASLPSTLASFVGSPKTGEEY